MMQPEYAALFEHRFIEDDRPTGTHTLMVQYRTSFSAMDGRRELFREVLEITVDARSGVASRIKAVAKQVDEEGSTFERLSALKNGLPSGCTPSRWGAGCATDWRAPPSWAATAPICSGSPIGL